MLNLNRKLITGFKTFKTQLKINKLSVNKLNQVQMFSFAENTDNKNSYTPKDALNYINNKFHLVEADATRGRWVQSLTSWLIVPQIFFGYKLIMKTVRVRPIGMAMYGALSYYTYRLKQLSDQGNLHLPTNVHLLEDGKTVSFTTPNGEEKSYDISKLKRVSTESIIPGVGSLLPKSIKDWIVFHAEDKYYYLIPYYKQLQNSDLFTAISEGKYVNNVKK